MQIALDMGCSDEHHLVLTIADNGVGIDGRESSAAPGRSGNGLALHSTLLAMVGGYLTVTSPHGGGTVVQIVAPQG